MKNINKLKLLIYTFLFVLFIFYITYKEKNYYQIPAISNNGNVNMVVEISAGTNHKIEYNSETNKFFIDKINGVDRIIDFLPYSVNYGFIPSTYMDTALGGDGDALDIILISESLPSKSVIEVIPIAMLCLHDNGKIDTKIIATPSDISKQVITSTNYNSLKENYPALIEILNIWFKNYKTNVEVQILGWKDEKEALQEIKKWMK